MCAECAEDLYYKSQKTQTCRIMHTGEHRTEQVPQVSKPRPAMFLDQPGRQLVAGLQRIVLHGIRIPEHRFGADLVRIESFGFAACMRSKVDTYLGTRCHG